MDYVYTCLCGAEDHWRIYNGKIKCQICGREYDISAFLNSAVFQFNENKEELCIKKPELESKSEKIEEKGKECIGEGK